MGFLSSFFGGGSSSSATHAPLITQAETLTKEQRELLDALVGNLQGGGVGTVGGFTPREFQPSAGRLAPGMTDLQGMSLEALEQQVLGMATGEGIFGESMGALSDIMARGPSDASDFFTKSIERPAMDRFSEDLIPEISRRLARDFQGGDRRRIEENAAEDLIDSLVAKRAEVELGVRESDLDRKLQAAGLAPGVMTQGLLATLGAGEVPRIIEQEQTGAERFEFEEGLEQEQRQIANILASLGIPAFENIVTPATVTQRGGGASGIGSLLAGIGALSGFIK